MPQKQTSSLREGCWRSSATQDHPKDQDSSIACETEGRKDTADLSETIEVLNEMASFFLSFEDHLVRLGHIPHHIACVGELHQLESEHAKLYEQVTFLERRIAKLKVSCDTRGVELGFGVEGLRRSALIDSV
ncbi:hypothetical protein F0562_034437 [Nyssa sinensis]|uniref:Uncharacterized protein n=1 Tax=Nyssa sinensis TaxID=561372 RepID=A0A5J5AIC0_9ASTE|nr:hypothetical protein F0562_034437 [Nyssa sinensis]